MSEPLTREQVGQYIRDLQDTQAEHMTLRFVAQEQLMSYFDVTRQELEQVTQERDAAIAVREKYDAWLQGGVYFTNEEFTQHLAEHRAQLTKAQATIARLQDPHLLHEQEDHL